VSNPILTKQNKDTENSGITAGVIVIGKIIDFDAQGRVLVDFNENQTLEPLIALTTLSLSKRNIARKVALLFNNGDINQPVIMGLIHNPLDEVLDNFELTPATNQNADSLAGLDNNKQTSTEIKQKDNNEVYVDGKRVCIEGAEEICFKCGKASITLTKSGKILIRGTYLLNRSTGVNRVMGGSVQIN